MIPTNSRPGRSAVAATMAMTVALVLGIAGPVAAADHVPFKGTLAGTVTVTPIDPPIASVAIEAMGDATHLGRYTFESAALVNQATRTGIGPASLVLTAANGDTLTAEATGQATPVAPGVLSIVETATITGGTGRFADATGTFVITRTFFVPAGMTTGSFAGTISVRGG